MRYWEITDKELLAEGKELFEKVLAGSNSNVKLWDELAPFEWEQYYQKVRGFNLCTGVHGVVPKDPDLDLPVGWRYAEYGAMPDARTKEGKRVLKVLRERECFVPYEDIYQMVGYRPRYFANGTALPQIASSRDIPEVFLGFDDRADYMLDPRFREVLRSYVERRLDEKAE